MVRILERTVIGGYQPARALVSFDFGQEVDTVVFMAIAIVAALLLIVTFLLGEVFEFFGDAVDLDDGDGIFNMQSIAAFLAGFGSIA